MATTLINGVSYNWGSVSFVAGGLPIVGITKIAYKKTQMKENIYGAGYAPVSRGYGNKEYEGSITIKREELNRLIDAAPNKNIEEIPPFDIPVVFSDGTRLQPRKDTLKMVEFKGFDMTTNQGDTSIDVEIELVIGDIVSI
jgi:hypothetical protein